MTFQVVQLMMLDCKHAVPLLVQNKDSISPTEVVKQLINADNKHDCRYFLHLYLHSLFEVNPHLGKDFHDMQVGIDLLTFAGFLCFGFFSVVHLCHSGFNSISVLKFCILLLFLL